MDEYVGGISISISYMTNAQLLNPWFELLR